MSSIKLDGFSWDEIEKKLDEIIEQRVDERIAKANKEAEEIRDENLALNLEVAELQKRVEILDRNSKRTSVIVQGLKVQTPKEFFIDLCEELLREKIKIVDTVRLPSGDHIFTLATVEQVRTILRKRGQFKGTCFVNKNLTRAERNKNYNIRMLGKKLSSSQNAKIRVGEFHLCVNNKIFTWHDGNVVAWNAEDAKMMNELLRECKIDLTCIVFNKKKFSPQNNKGGQQGSSSKQGACFLN